MEWKKVYNSVSSSTSYSNSNNNNSSNFGVSTEGMVEGGLYVKVMTDEQMLDLRRQIAAYGYICEELVERHKAIMDQQDSLAGMKQGSFYCDPLMMSGGVPRISSRQRWGPTPMQLQILENIFEKGSGTPSKQKIKEITYELLQHGPVAETNVYNWFQNRRARSKRKQTTTVAPTIKSESEVEGQIGSSDEKKARLDKTNSFQRPDVSSKMGSMVPEASRTQGIMTYPSINRSSSSGSVGGMSFYDASPSNPRMDNLLGKMEISECFSPFQLGEGYDMMG